MIKGVVLLLSALLMQGSPSAMAQSHWKTPDAKGLPTIRFADPQVFSVVKSQVSIPITQLPPDITQLDQGFCYAHTAAYVTEYWRCKEGKGLCSALFTSEKLSVTEFTEHGAELLKEGGFDWPVFQQTAKGDVTIRQRSCTHENQIMTTVFGTGSYVYTLNTIGPEILGERYRARVKNVLLPLLPDQLRAEMTPAPGEIYPRSLEFMRKAWEWNQGTNNAHAAQLANALLVFYGLPLSLEQVQSALRENSPLRYYEALLYKKDCKEKFTLPKYDVQFHVHDRYTDLPPNSEYLGTSIENALSVIRTSLQAGELPMLGVCMTDCDKRRFNGHSIVVTGIRQVCQRNGRACRDEIQVQWHWGNGFQILANSGWADAGSLFGPKLDHLQTVVIAKPSK